MKLAKLFEEIWQQWPGLDCVRLLPDFGKSFFKKFTFIFVFRYLCLYSFCIILFKVNDFLYLNSSFKFWLYFGSGNSLYFHWGREGALKDTENQTKPNSAMARYGGVWFSLWKIRLQDTRIYWGPACVQWGMFKTYAHTSCHEQYTRLYWGTRLGFTGECSRYTHILGALNRIHAYTAETGLCLLGNVQDTHVYWVPWAGYTRVLGTRHVLNYYTTLFDLNMVARTDYSGCKKFSEREKLAAVFFATIFANF